MATPGQMSACTAAEMERALVLKAGSSWRRQWSSGSNRTRVKTLAELSPAISDLYPTSTRPGTAAPSELCSDWGSESEDEEEQMWESGFFRSSWHSVSMRVAGVFQEAKEAPADAKGATDEDEELCAREHRGRHAWCTVGGRLAGVFREAATEYDEDQAHEEERWRAVGLRLSKVFAGFAVDPAESGIED